MNKSELTQYKEFVIYLANQINKSYDEKNKTLNECCQSCLAKVFNRFNDKLNEYTFNFDSVWDKKQQMYRVNSVTFFGERIDLMEEEDNE